MVTTSERVYYCDRTDTRHKVCIFIKGTRDIDRWNKMTVAGEDTDFLDEYNFVIIDGSISNIEDNNETDDKEQKDIFVNL